MSELQSFTLKTSILLFPLYSFIVNELLALVSYSVSLSFNAFAELISKFFVHIPVLLKAC